MERSISIDSKEFEKMVQPKGFKLSASFKDPIREDRDISFYDKGETAKEYASIKKSSHNGRVVSIEYSSYDQKEHENLIKQALSSGYRRISDVTPTYEQGQLIVSPSSFVDFQGNKTYITVVSDQLISTKIGL
ncbi:hypothetical protein [Daejeonella lutea]|nr:hypothetical protein [Daejeonella lutea]